MKAKPLPTRAYLRECLFYDPATGEIQWRERPRHHFRRHGDFVTWNINHAGTSAGCGTRKDRYLAIKIDGGAHTAGRLIWRLVHGIDRDQIIDHIDGNPRNNRLINLRVTNAAGNARNAKRRKDSTSGVTGVYRLRSGFKAEIQVDGRQRYLGSFKTLKEAAAARKGAEAVLGYHPNHGRAGND